MPTLSARLPNWTVQFPLFTLAASLAVLGALGIASADFAFQWQPVPAQVPARQGLAMGVGLLELVAGLLVLPARTRGVGIRLVAAVLVGWAALHLPPVASRPGSVADWLGLAEASAMAAAMVSLAASAAATSVGRKVEHAGMIVFGLSAIIFGASHFVYADFTAAMVPEWLPQRLALAYLTGAGHLLAGIAITFGVVRALAAALEGLMMLSFVVLVHVPRVLAHPDSRMEWTMLGVAVTLCGSAALVAAISDRHSRRR